MCPIVNRKIHIRDDSDMSLEQSTPIRGSIIYTEPQQTEPAIFIIIASSTSSCCYFGESLVRPVTAVAD
jgi:hypothetical protein